MIWNSVIFEISYDLNIGTNWWIQNSKRVEKNDFLFLVLLRNQIIGIKL